MNPTTKTRHCIGINDIPPHEVPWDAAHLGPWAMDPNRKNIRCRDCDREYRRSRRSAKAGQAPAQTRRVEQELSQVRFTDVEREPGSHEYVPTPKLVSLWKSVVTGAIDHGDPPANLVFFGPSGSGKTSGAQYLADLVGLPLTKVDAASMTDPESWFGTREVVVSEGVSVTKYVPSQFVEAVQKPGVVFIDEMTRVDDEHRNVLLPLTDGTGKVTNPLTGDIVERHPHCFIVMAGNRGLQFTGTSAVDPAFTTRALTVEFDYIEEAAERKVAIDETGCDATTATVFVKFAQETRLKAQADPDFPPISTREVIAACRLAARGLERDLAAEFAIINQTSGEGGAASIRQELQNIWAGVRLTREEVDAPDAEKPETDGWACPTHHGFKLVPAGTSMRTGKPYNAFRACPVYGCDETEDRSSAQKVCASCGVLNPPGRTTICSSCGAAL